MPLEQADLVAAAKDGDRAAFEELVRATYADAYTLAYRLTGDEEDARDVVQDAYLRAYRGLKRFRGDAQFSTWMYRIVANCAATTTARRSKNRHDDLADEGMLADDRPEIDPEMMAEALAVMRYIHVENWASPRKRRMPFQARRYDSCTTSLASSSLPTSRYASVYASAYVARTRSSKAERSPALAAVTRSARSAVILPIGPCACGKRYAGDNYRVSLWAVCLRSHLQYFFISMRSRSLILFLTVM